MSNVTLQMFRLTQNFLRVSKRGPDSSLNSRIIKKITKTRSLLLKIRNNRNSPIFKEVMREECMSLDRTLREPGLTRSRMRLRLILIKIFIESRLRSKHQSCLQEPEVNKILL